MRNANYAFAAMNLVGLACCIVSLNGDLMQLIGRVCGETGQTVAACGLAVCCILNGLMCGDFFGRAAFGADEDQ